MNAKVLQTLEYHKIIEMLAVLTDSPMGEDKVRSLHPSDQLSEINCAQEETAHCLARIYRQGAPSFHGLRDIKGSLVLLEKGSVLSAKELLAIGKTLDVAKGAIAYDAKEEVTDAISGRFHSLDSVNDLNRELNRCILSEDEIADDASSELHRIRMSIKSTNDKVHEQLNQIVSSSQTMMQDSLITMRNGRYCLPIKSEYKSSFSGMIHDQSSSGSTFFIEPMAIVKLNNTLTELASKEHEEIERILASLSNMAALYIDSLRADVLVLSELDFLFAKGKLAKKMKASQPLFDEEYIEIKNGRHPLIDPAKVVPINVSLGKDYHLLIITGPNTGGKTVSLKTVGLLTLMGQSGLHIPAAEHSHLRVYKEVFADIGDEQSIEQSLSTFSSHMTNTVDILSKADENSLALFDELGAGTDPTEGAALAIAILNELHGRNTTAMATTHYSELKIFALQTEDVENASCEFDVATLRPTYRLNVGIPGKSNAFAISGKLGLSKHIIENASSLIDQDAKNFEDVISSLEESRKTIEKERAQISEYKKEISALKQKLTQKNKQIDDNREKIIAKAKEDANELLQEAKEFADSSIRKYNKWMSDSGVNREMEKERAELRKRLDETTAKQTQNKKRNTKAPKKLSVGDTVYVHSMDVKGTVSTLPNEKGELFVQMGILRSQVHISDLELIKEDTFTVNGKKAVRSQASKIGMSKALSVTTEINLIGKTVDEAMPLLDKYLDDAYLSHLNQVTVIHGIGTGALKSAVWSHLKRTNYVKSYRQGEFGEGGYGVTIVEFKEK